MNVDRVNIRALDEQQIGTMNPLEAENAGRTVEFNLLIELTGFRLCGQVGGEFGFAVELLRFHEVWSRLRSLRMGIQPMTRRSGK